MWKMLEVLLHPISVTLFFNDGELSVLKQWILAIRLSIKSKKKKKKPAKIMHPKSTSHANNNFGCFSVWWIFSENYFLNPAINDWSIS